MEFSKNFLFLFSICFGSVLTESTDSPARLLFSKVIQNRYLVEGQDIVVKYEMFNVGSMAALEVVLKDHSFPSEAFDVVGGFMKAKWDRIAPGSNVTHTIVLRPRKHGYFNFTPAELHYYPSEESKTVQVAFSSDIGERGIVASKDYDRLFSPHLLDWTAFAIMCIPPLAIPFSLWYSSKVKYDAYKPKKM